MSRTAVREVADLYFQRFEAHLEKRLAELESRSERRLGDVRTEIRVEIANQRANLVKWMFLFWIGTLVPLGGLIVGLLRFKP